MAVQHIGEHIPPGLKIELPPDIMNKVVAKFKSSMDKATKDKAYETVKGLLGQIPEAKGVVVGPPLSDKATQGYDYGASPCL